MFSTYMISMKSEFVKTRSFCPSYSVNPEEHSSVEPGKDMTIRRLITIPEHLQGFHQDFFPLPLM